MRPSIVMSETLMRMVQYTMWKVKKRRGKTILAYRSISLARQPKRVAGTSSNSRADLSFTVSSWCNGGYTEDILS